MQPLHIALHDGFRDSVVTITADGKQVYQRAGVTTDLSLARADALDVSVGAKTVIAVIVDPGRLRGTCTIDASAHPYLAIRVVDGKVEFEKADEPFRYM